MSIPGDLINSDYQYEFRGLLFGAGTDYITTAVNGLLSAPDAVNRDTDSMNGHGAVPGILTGNKRTVEFDLSIIGGSGLDIEQKLNAAQEAFQLPRRRYSREMEPLIFRRPGQPAKVIYVRCERREFESNYNVAHGLAEGSVQLVAPDPIIYSLEEHTAVIELAPGDTNGQIEVYQFGNLVDGAPCTLEIQGPATNPIVGNVTDDNRQVKTTVVLTAANTLVVDQKTLDSTLDGADAFGSVRNDSQYWQLLPKKNVITFSRAGGNTAATARLTIRWRDAWQ